MSARDTVHTYSGTISVFQFSRGVLGAVFSDHSVVVVDLNAARDTERVECERCERDDIIHYLRNNNTSYGGVSRTIRVESRFLTQSRAVEIVEKYRFS